MSYTPQNASGAGSTGALVTGCALAALVVIGLGAFGAAVVIMLTKVLP